LLVLVLVLLVLVVVLLCLSAFKFPVFMMLLQILLWVCSQGCGEEKARCPFNVSLKSSIMNLAVNAAASANRCR
jgi:hypothetical protein